MITIDVKDLMNKILNDAIENRASDIHIYPHTSGESFIKLRVRGQLSEYEKFSNREIEAIILNIALYKRLKGVYFKTSVKYPQVLKKSKLTLKIKASFLFFKMLFP